MRKLVVCACITSVLLSLAAPAAQSVGDNKSLYDDMGRSRGKSEVSQIRTELNKNKDMQAALAKLEALIKREPDNTEAHMLCGTLLQYMGFEKLADEQYAIVDKLDPTRPTSALAQFKTKLALQGPHAAYEYLRYVEGHFPNDPSVLLMQGMIERTNGNQIEAEYYYQTALRLHPNTPGIASALAALRIMQKRYREAINLADLDLKLKKDHPAALLAKGQALVLMGRSDEAIPHLQKVLGDSSLERKEPADLIVNAYVQNGQCSEALLPALIAMSRISMKDTALIDRYKTRLLFLLNRAKCSELGNSLEIALKDIRDIDRQAWLCYAAGDVLDRGGCLKEAEVAFSLGLRYRPMGRGYLRLAKTNEKRGDSKGAYLFYGQAAMTDGKDPEVVAANLRNKAFTDHKGDLAWQLKNWLRSLHRQN